MIGTYSKALKMILIKNNNNNNNNNGLHERSDVKISSQSRLKLYL